MTEGHVVPHFQLEDCDYHPAIAVRFDVLLPGGHNVKHPGFSLRPDPFTCALIRMNMIQTDCKCPAYLTIGDQGHYENKARIEWAGIVGTGTGPTKDLATRDAVKSLISRYQTRMEHDA